ncbi:DUF4880 domain-containing protein [Corticibacter populi]|uniref:DUF4880 domain-containing protein n=1 Tax=Corticibacter populi TaxID=1550736 RepID=A0A3M6QY77_9BURK|nr:FecR domain-containing protein [Corticibacter populi]RMX07976.1 DUF4880 domain-containing protein [Corticibacter populi]RZS35218.1 FecR family protein [Corticibacter populi]
MNKPIPPGISAEALVAVHEQAADWQVRRLRPDWQPADEHALRAWLNQDALHAQVFASMDRTRLAFGQLKGLVTDASPAAVSEPGTPRRPHRRRRPSPAMAAVACMVLALLGGGGFYWWDNTPRYSMAYRTQGEGQRIRLPDGSQIDLNVHSGLQVRYYPRRRQAVLDGGEAFFDVAADAGRPFTVASGAARIRVVGTAFNVRAAPPALVVQVSEGLVEVSTAKNGQGGARKVLLKAGTGLALDPASGAYQPLQPAAGSIGQWRTGQIRFDQTPLGEVVAEIARYLRQPVRLQGAALADLPVSGYFSLRDPEAFIELLASTVPVRVERRRSEGPGLDWVILPR